MNTELSLLRRALATNNRQGIADALETQTGWLYFLQHYVRTPSLWDVLPDSQKIIMTPKQKLWCRIDQHDIEALVPSVQMSSFLEEMETWDGAVAGIPHVPMIWDETKHYKVEPTNKVGVPVQVCGVFLWSDGRPRVVLEHEKGIAGGPQPPLFVDLLQHIFLRYKKIQNTLDDPMILGRCGFSARRIIYAISAGTQHCVVHTEINALILPVVLKTEDTQQ